MSDAQVQVIGVCRWSYPADHRDFQASKKDIRNTRAALYASWRLEHRLFLLEHLVLPALRSQTDKDFTLIFLMGDQLPRDIRDRVLALLAPIPQIRPVIREEGCPQAEIIREEIARIRDVTKPVTAQFRLDDDDAVAVDFVANVKSHYAEVEPIFRRHGLFGLDFTQGFLMRMSVEKGIRFSTITARWWAPGMAVFVDGDRPETLFDFHHLKLWHDMPTLMTMEKPMYIRGVHDSNDSNVTNIGRRTISFPFKSRHTQVFLRDHFGLDVKTLKEVWAQDHPYFSMPGLRSAAE